jgi:hypothetical protein
MKAQSSHVMHFVDCEAAKRVREDRRQPQVKCGKCAKLFETLLRNMKQQEVESALAESTR